ncbi:MAG: hypothetical protein KME29_23025 [Calothrix sp. FI2-JRJ7]|nr:hypothetical protein [Calothrix sp. FI2-JRJ7]
MLAIKSEDNTVKILNLLGKQLAEFKPTSEINDLSFSIDGKQLITVSQDGKIQSWNFDGKILTDLNIGNSKLNYARFSPNGKTIVTAEADGILRVWDISGRKLAELSSYDSNFKGVSFSYDSQRIAIRDLNEARIWELSGRQIGVFSLFKDFTPDGKYVITHDYPNVQIESIKRLDELLDEGCNWLQDYFLKNPEALEKLYVCQVNDLGMEKPVDKKLIHNIQNKLNK